MTDMLLPIFHPSDHKKKTRADIVYQCSSNRGDRMGVGTSVRVKPATTLCAVTVPQTASQSGRVKLLRKLSPDPKTMEHSPSQKPPRIQPLRQCSLAPSNRGTPARRSLASSRATSSCSAVDGTLGCRTPSIGILWSTMCRSIELASDRRRQLLTQVCMLHRCSFKPESAPFQSSAVDYSVSLVTPLATGCTPGIRKISMS